MAFKDWPQWLKGIIFFVGVMLIVIVFIYWLSDRYGRQEQEPQIIVDGKTYQLLPIAVLAEPEECLLDDDFLKDKGKVIGIKSEALQRMAGAQPFTLAELARMFELLAGDEDTSLEARSTRQSFASLTKKTLLADKNLVEQLKGEPGRTGGTGRAGRDAKIDKTEIRSVVQQVLASQPIKKETLVTDHTQEIAGLRAEMDAANAKLAELEEGFDALTVIKRTKVTGGAKIRIGGDDE